MSDASFPWVVAASTFLDGIAAALVLWLPRRSSAGEDRRLVGLGRVLASATAAIGVFLFKLVFLVPLGLNVFGIIHLIYADAVVMVPAIGSGLLIGSSGAWLGSRRLAATPAARLVALASLGLFPVGWYATWVEPFRLQVETTSVSLPPARVGTSTIRVGVLADLQTRRITDYERGTVTRLMGQKPDLIVVPGDLFQGSPEEFEACRADLHDLLARLSAPSGVYLVLGDMDAPGEKLESLLRSTEVRLLVDEVVRVPVGDRQVTIGGVELDVNAPAARETVERLEHDPGEGDVRILVAHRPDAVLDLSPRSRIDLVIAGHTHGGQIVVPGFGPPLTLTHVPRAVAAGGLHALGGNRIYVSRGVGCERGQAPRIRLFCPPEISRIELGATHAD